MVKKLNQLMAISEVMMVATRPLTIKQIASKASRLTGKLMTEAAAERKLREFEKAANFVVVKTTGDNPRSAPRYEGIMGPENFSGALPAVAVAVAKPLNTPQPAAPRPISFGRPSSNATAPVTAAPEPPARVAGSRSALAYIETLGGNG